MAFWLLLAASFSHTQVKHNFIMVLNRLLRGTFLAILPLMVYSQYVFLATFCFLPAISVMKPLEALTFQPFFKPVITTDFLGCVIFLFANALRFPSVDT